LTDQDTANGQRVAVVNERFVKRFLEGRNVLSERVVMGKFGTGAARLGFGPGAPGYPVEWQIVGVFRDISNLEQFDDPVAPQIYLPFAQSPWLQAVVSVRTATDAAGLYKNLAAEVYAMDPDLPLTEVRTMDQIIGERLAPDKLNIALYGGLAALALILAVMGIYGVMTYTVTQRTPEIGLRMALGAAQVKMQMEILQEGLKLAVCGLVLGVAGAYALGRAMQSALYGTGALSLPVLVAVSLVLLGSALVACYLPARRASAVDPMIALRQE
jgi:putative ABC transport system permease protein